MLASSVRCKGKASTRTAHPGHRIDIPPCIIPAMPSERVQEQIENLLDDAEDAVEQHDWQQVLKLTDAILEVDPENEDALSFERMAETVEEESWVEEIFREVVGLVFILTIYMLPTGIAMLRNKRNKLSIFSLNLLLGWTLVGWVVALVWGVSHRGD